MDLSPNLKKTVNAGLAKTSHELFQSWIFIVVQFAELDIPFIHFF